jgi:hypothetical protein
MTTLNLNDQVYYVKKYGDRPRTGTVTRVTKTQVRITPDGGQNELGPFKREGWDGRHERIGSRSKWDGGEVYPRTTTVWETLNARADAVETARAEREAKRDQQLKERDERIAAELAEVKEAWFAKDPRSPDSFGDIMPDGSRIYTVDIPVKPEYAERKKNWERVIVRCWDGEEIDWRNNRMKPIVESAYTYCNGSSCSFSSVSTNRTATDEEAVWDAIRSQYHRW